MVNNTRVTELLGIQYPIIQGGLQGLGKYPLVSAVSNAGGLGLITAGSYPSKIEMIEDIQRTREDTDRPFGVNIAIGIRRPMDEFVEGVIESGVKIVFTSGYSPAKYIDQFKQDGIKVFHVISSVKHAIKAQELGCDGVVAVGFECGGHPGVNEISSKILLKQVLQSVDIPVIAAGGFTDGEGLVSALALGAEGIQMGTRFVMTHECPLHPDVKDILLKANSTDTTIIKRSIGKPNRVYNSLTAQKVIELEHSGAQVNELLPYIGGEAYQNLIDLGDINSGVISLGQGIGSIDKIISAEQVIKNTMKEAEKTLERLISLRQSFLLK